ncbi:MAG: sulfatase-like hydrolase/transferase [Phycisphaerae bacterium]|nr:sulfatase-like hydrolase/transferase [Phycisphaerae bacterium]
MNRRQFLSQSGMAALGLPSISSYLAAAEGARDVRPSDRPNILWITCEDISPNLGCYGDPYAVTPNLDHLAAQGVRYDNAFAPIGVCAPARSCIITGMYPPSIGTQHMRCKGTLPPEIHCFPEYLRQAGYYCTNNAKTDYNFKHPEAAWDECNRRAHWRKRGKGQPFFAVFNYTSCHESQIRLLEGEYQKRTANFKPGERHDPAKAPVPPYHPDTPEVRKDWARYYDMITFMDKQVGGLLGDLDADGLADDTIVMFYSDHGAGMPRSKRWLYDSSLRVPMLVRFPEKYRYLAPGAPGSATDRLVSFVDLAPTVLSLAGVQVPSYMQGEAFLGKQAAEPRRYVYGYRDRMDERYDMIRCVRDKRYKYIHNYMPHHPWFHHQHISYMYQIPTMRVWQRLADEGKLTGPAAVFMAKTKPPEELYDTQADPWEVRNLASDPNHRDTLERLRKAHVDWVMEIRDLGFLPEADLRTRFGGRAPYEAVRKTPEAYPLERILAAADLASRMQPEALPKLLALLKDKDAAVRYWAVVGLSALGDKAGPAAEAVAGELKDSSPEVRIIAAELLCRLGRVSEGLPVLIDGLTNENEWVRLRAANLLDHLDEKARPAFDAMTRASKAPKQNPYVNRVLDHALGELKG